MYKLYHSDVVKPMIFDTWEEVRMYTRLMILLGKGEPRWTKLPNSIEK